MQNSNLATLTKTLELQAKIARDFSELQALNEKNAIALVSQLAQMLGLNRSAMVVEKKPSTRERPGYDLIAKLFVEHGNSPMTKVEISKMSGVVPSSVHTVLYTTQKERFIRTPNPTGAKEKLISLTDQAFIEAKQAMSTTTIQQ